MKNYNEEIIILIKNFKTILLPQKFRIFSRKSNVLIGLNGAGKSNLLKSLNHLQNPEAEIQYKPQINEEKIITSYKKIYDEGTEISIKLNLTNKEIIIINDKLKEIKLDSLNNIFNNTSLSKKITNDTSYSLKNKKGILFDLIRYIFEKKNETINDYITDFFPDYKNNNFLPLIEDKTKILNKLKKETNQHIKKIFEIIYWLIDEVLNNKINILYIENANDNAIEHIYKLRDYFDKNDVDLNKKREIEEIFNFFDPKNEYSLISKMSDYYNLDQNNDKAIDIKRNVEKIVNKKLREIFEKFSIYAEFIFEISNKTFRIDFSNKNEKFFIEDKIPKNSSSGFNSFFQIIFKTNIYKNKKRNETFIFLFDEPEKNLYLKLQTELFGYINDIIEKNENIYIIFSTHSPYMVDPNNQNIIYIERDEYGSSKIKNLENFNDSLTSENRKLINDALTLKEAQNNSNLKEISKNKVIWYESNLTEDKDFNENILNNENIRKKFDIKEVKNKNRTKFFNNHDFLKDKETVLSAIKDFYSNFSEDKNLDIYLY